MRKAALLTLLGLGLLSINSCTSSTPTSSAPPSGTSMADVGTISIESTSIAVGVGVSWGDGVLQYRGNRYAFTVDGLSVLDLGVSKVTATGTVANLKRLEDFSGNYVAAGAGAVVGGGAGAAVLRNQNGVDIALTATGQGVRFSLAGSGVNVKLKQ
jgi:hypothetical protein